MHWSKLFQKGVKMNIGSRRASWPINWYGFFFLGCLKELGGGSIDFMRYCEL